MISVAPPYSRTGCFYHTPDLELISTKYRYLYLVWDDPYSFAQMVTGCAALAWRRGFSVFGVEFAGECWATNKAANYQANGVAPDDDWEGCKHNVGIENRAVSVFEFQ